MEELLKKNTARNLKLNTNKNPESKTEADKGPDLDGEDDSLDVEAVADNAVPDIE